MALAFPLLASSSPANSGFPLWQTLGATVVVVALLLLFLRLLSRLPGAGPRGAAEVLAVWPLGPKREIQVLRLREAVHFVYRQDGGLVLLETGSLADYRAEHPVAAGRPRPGILGGLAGRLLSLAGSRDGSRTAGAAPRS
jgi:hypothetical protein